MTYFEQGTEVGRLKLRHWSSTEIDSFVHRIQQVLDRLNWTPPDLDIALGYAPEGKMTAQILGLFGNGRRRQPSRPYVRKFEQLEANPPSPDSRVSVPSMYFSRGAIPIQKILSVARQCPMCVVEYHDGLRPEAETWWWFGHPCQRYCSPEHRKAWHRQRKKQCHQESQSLKNREENDE